MYKNYLNSIVFIYTVNKQYKGKLISENDEFITLMFPNTETINISKQHIISISSSIITG